MKKQMAILLTVIVAVLLAGCGTVDQAPPPAAAQPMIALTFDDGPGPHTDRILDLLELHGGRATFFVLGRNVEAWQDTIIRTVNIGSEVAGHTWTHPELPSLTNEEITAEIRSTSVAIERLTGVPQRIYRPPYGKLIQRVVNVSRDLGYTIVNWTFDTFDWRPENQDVNVLFDSIMNAARDGTIVLMHDTIPETAAAMELVIPALIAEGFQLVTVTELLYHTHGGLTPGRVHGVNWNMPGAIIW